MKFSLIFISTLFISACSSKVDVEAIKVTTGSVQSTVSTINSGTIEAKKQAMLAFGTVGRIAKIHVSLGSTVEKGQIIAELENADLQAINEEANKEFQRTTELFQNGLVSNAYLDNQRKIKEVARVNLQKTQIIAPFKGMVTSLELKIGEFFQNAQVGINNKPSVQLIDLEQRLVKGEIDEVDLQNVKIGQESMVRVPALKNQKISAKVSKVVPFVSTAKDQDRTSQIELEITDNKVLIPVGASADVEIVTSKKDQVLMIPTHYILGVGSKKYVLKINDGKIKKQDIVIGLSNYDRSEILEGLKKDDLIAKAPEGIEVSDDTKVNEKIKSWPSSN